MSNLTGKGATSNMDKSNPEMSAKSNAPKEYDNMKLGASQEAVIGAGGETKTQSHETSQKEKSKGTMEKCAEINPDRIQMGQTTNEKRYENRQFKP